jgi:hypothetical protein
VDLYLATYGPNRLFRNDGAGAFVEVGRDHRRPGHLLRIVSHLDRRGTAALLRNDGGNRKHWLGLTLVGIGGPASAIGAVVTVEAGGSRQVKVNQWGPSYLSQHDPRLD